MDMKILSGLVNIEKLQDFLREINNVSSAHGVTIQALNSDLIAGERHITFAAEKANIAMEKGTNVAKDPGIEIMRYASGKRQIEEAFSMGLHEGVNRVAFVLMGENEAIGKAAAELGNVMDEKPLIDYTPEKRDKIVSQFNITDMEIETVGEDRISDLVIERVALVDIMK